MVKIKLCGMGSDTDFNLNYIIVKKDKNLFKGLSNLFKGVSSYNETDRYYDKKDHYRSRRKQLKDYIDVHENIRLLNKKARVDIFYGKNKVFISFIDLIKEYKDKLMENLKKYAEWKSVKEHKYRRVHT